MIILDLPKFAPTAAQAEKAARGYKDINLLAFKLLRPGGSWSPSPAPAEWMLPYSRKLLPRPYWMQG